MMRKSLMAGLVAFVAVVAVALAQPLIAQDGQARTDNNNNAADADAPAQRATLGQPAPDFTLKDHEGNDVTLSALRGKIVVLEWFNPQCPFVVYHYRENIRTMAKLADKFRDKDVVWLAINSSHFSTPEFNAEWVKTWSIPFAVLNDADGRTGRAYAATHTPHMFVIDKEGTLVYQGGIDDNPNGRRSETTPFVKNALKDLVNERPIAIANTRPYGCTVKYAGVR